MGGTEELRGDPTIGLRSKVWIRGQKLKKLCQRWSAREAQMRTIQKEVSQILQKTSAGQIPLVN